MQKAWYIGAAAVLAIGAGVLFITERPLTVAVVQPDPC
jgi:HlyD family secretion protein